MIITRTPYRIFFIGDEANYSAHDQRTPVIATTINHHCYLHCRFLPPFFDYQSRFVGSTIEEVLTHDAISQPTVKAILAHLKVNQGIEINHQADLPAQKELGAQAAFTVGLLQAIYALQGLASSKRDLATEAHHIEQALVKDSILHDSIATAYGGLNKISTHPNGHFDIAPLVLPLARLRELHSHLLLFFTGAVTNPLPNLHAIPQKNTHTTTLNHLVEEAQNLLCSNQPIHLFGELLRESANLKQQLQPHSASPIIDAMYAKAYQAGAIGGKQLGTDSRFILFFVSPEHQSTVCEALSDLSLVPFDFETSGSQIIFYDHLNHPNQMAMMRRDYQYLSYQQKNYDKGAI